MESAGGNSAALSDPLMEPCQPDSEILLALVYQHALTNLAGQGKFSPEMMEKLQTVQTRKNLMLAVDPHDINIADVKGFVLNEFKMTNHLVEMVVILGKNVVPDSDFISELIARGDLEKVGTTYNLEYIFLPAQVASPTVVDQQNFLDGLLKQSDPEGGHPLHPISPAPSSANSTLSASPSTSRRDRTPDPEMLLPLARTVTVDLQSPERSGSAASTSDGSLVGSEAAAPRAASRKRQRAVKSAASAETPLVSIIKPPAGVPAEPPEPKRMQVWMPNNNVAAAARSVSGGSVTELRGTVAPAQVFDSGFGPVVNASIMNIPVPTGLPALKPKRVSPRRVQSVPAQQMATAPDPGRRWTITSRQLALMSQLVQGHRKVTITFEDEHGNSQTVCVENRA
ncbi:uncharacterized protein LOC129592134 [Paramacrobiotus metropolitanus]|uniref:uncharacterized protein LOC129592134 n=1 Tax=Paramacrobiotus metropolitanus TaxID=2943436 RepID=UPI0024462AA1|nr:uncharacterized protein LOC129592134 [Paramacrobiotus metropolitanus]XP_055344075.1 uncharacterized protein LOC129592134 [Paramacrobiotus metropolitanus]XP_055344076.1 uncharacterized protein LOC129592134 [Paramacrobiotus metropolitanus]XP_055344077.1 uncharacterized protein LOC129592134 [Paramacrobiotus metropolitanus]XP_055344078.1 uncharacterized protein LOC129592134 [Paramacrobiotus metropolitanus]